MLSREEPILKSFENKPWAALFVVALIASIGCRLTLPVDRGVRISEQQADDKRDDSIPKTRLAPSGKGLESAPRQQLPLQSSTPQGQSSILPSDRFGKVGVEVETPYLGKPVTMRLTDDESGDSSVDQLLRSLRNASPEVRRRILGQLGDDSGGGKIGVNSTSQPQGINDELTKAIDSLPSLPEDGGLAKEISPRLPSRIAAHGLATVTAQSRGDIAKAVGIESDQVNPVTIATSVAELRSGSVSVGEIGRVAGAPQHDLADPGMDDLIQALVEKHESNVPDETEAERFRRLMLLAYFRLMSGDDIAKVEGFETLNASQQAFIREHLMVCRKLLNPVGSLAIENRLASTIADVHAMARNTANLSPDLAINGAAFCREVIGYGQVTRHEGGEFRPGQKVILYCEIENFIHHAVEGSYQTEVRGSYEIVNAMGKIVFVQELPADRQQCDRPMRDYFVAYEMHLPQIEPGDYRLQLKMECVLGRKFGNASIPLTINE